jgi:hypothetical protein
LGGLERRITVDLKPIDECEWFKEGMKRICKKDKETERQEALTVNRFKLANDFKHPDGKAIAHCSPTVGIEFSDFDICDLDRMLTCQLCNERAEGDADMELAWSGGCDCTCPKCDVQGSPIVTARCALIITTWMHTANDVYKCMTDRETLRMCKSCACAWDEVYGLDIYHKMVDSNFIYSQYERDE